MGIIEFQFLNNSIYKYTSNQLLIIIFKIRINFKYTTNIIIIFIRTE
mgnify:CR=1 FL=1